MTATTCDTGGLLLRNVLSDPGSDDSRLIYADWLDEQDGTGDAQRARYIRWQLAPDTPPRNVPLSVLATLDLLTGLQPHAYGYNTAPRKGESHVGYANGTEFRFRRGLLDEVRCPLAWFLARGRDLFDRHPITAVVIFDREPVQRATGRWSWEWDRDAAEPIGWNRVLYGLAMESDPYGVMAWPTPEDARRVLSGYLVNCGRKLAGLSPLG